MEPLPSPPDAQQVTQREWPTLRCRLIDVAASLDRLERSGADDARAEAEQLLQELLREDATPRAERLLKRLSRPYDPAWRERFAAGETAID